MDDKNLSNATYPTLSPAFCVSDKHEDEPVCVVFAANDYYAPYLATLLASICARRSKERRYDFIVLSEDMSDHNAQALRTQVMSESTSLRLLDVTKAMSPFQDKLRIKGHFKMETYFRLLLPQILPEYHKVLYLDSDMVCLRDVAELFDTDVEGYLVAACKDPDTTGLYNDSPLDVGLKDYRTYMDEILKIERPYDYFQAGTILFNLDAWRASIDINEVFLFAQSYNWHLLDQDVLNYFCQGRVRFVDMAWNVMYDFDGVRIAQIISYTSPELFEDYQRAREHPYIIHYAGPTKPWDDLKGDFAESFWMHSRMSAGYEEALFRVLSQRHERLHEHDRAVHESLQREIDHLRGEIDGLRQWLVTTNEDIRVMDEYLHAVEDELQRFEKRPIGLMAKELIYQKILTPAAEFISRGDSDKRERLHRLYRKIHPKRQ